LSAVAPDRMRHLWRLTMQNRLEWGIMTLLRGVSCPKMSLEPGSDAELA
jgi:hypothetical protein